MGRDRLEVGEDAALEMVNLVDAFLLEKCRRFFTANAARAEHGHPSRCSSRSERVACAAEPRRKFLEACGSRIDRSGKRTNCNFIFVARIDDDSGGIVDQGVPIARVDISPRVDRRVDAWPAHGHDLSFQADLQAVEWHGRRTGEFDVEVAATGPPANVFEHTSDAVVRSGYRAVDPLSSDDQRAFDALLEAQSMQRPAQPPAIIKPRKTIDCSDAKRIASIVDLLGHDHRVPEVVTRQRCFFEVVAVKSGSFLATQSTNLRTLG